MTDARKKELQKTLRSKCGAALVALAANQELYITLDGDGAMIRGPHGYISDILHGDGAHDKDFEPGFGKEEHWTDFLNSGPWLSYSILDEDGRIEKGDNFDAGNPKDVREVLEVLRILPV